ncbi:ABC transporter permease subunit [Plastoroseomonas hellenica]|uniref:ABC transporter permease subunit n=1 Tax=Plastoroseomonas hellenica TaxID=2687306 RepID=UPI001BA86D01|nr:ABC transporter permease subunit [Plastoroseomonas hellenica]MBR0646945.1 ABC transporter permease subunit [Plastoroseomonas hellenica]
MRGAIGTLALGCGFALLSLAPVAAALFAALGGETRAFGSGALLDLALAHLRLAGLGALAGIALGVALGLLVTRADGGDWRRPVDALAAAAQATPPMVVVALALPAFGFGDLPTVLALILYTLMPVLRGTVAAVEAVAPDARAAAVAIGLTPWQVLCRVDLPLAWPLLLPALRVAVMLAVATTAVGALAGAATLGTPIILGLQNRNDLYIFQGAAATAAIAFLADGALLMLAARAAAKKPG